MNTEDSNPVPQLPSSPPGKTGWPWTLPKKEAHTLRCGKGAWPKICIVTPSFNQGAFLEETIRSVLAQEYPNLEYIVIDGGSTDDSVEIIKKYEPWLKYWVSERDGGQAEAIAKGFDMASSDILGWLNSDDFLLPGALSEIGNTFAATPDLELLVGGGIVVDENSERLRKLYSFPQSYDSLLSIGQFMMQMSCFWKRETYHAVGGLDKNLRFCFDYDLFIRLANQNSTQGTDSLLSAFRIHGKSKTSTIYETVALPEIEVVKRRYFSSTLNEQYYSQQEKTHRKQYHTNIRINILKDIYRDFPHFLAELRKKFAFHA
jgi:glycosyltransferase involved in cell wall biosynthesis